MSVARPYLGSGKTLLPLPRGAPQDDDFLCGEDEEDQVPDQAYRDASLSFVLPWIP